MDRAKSKVTLSLVGVGPSLVTARVFSCSRFSESPREQAVLKERSLWPHRL